MRILYPYKNALWALRLCNRGRLLSVRHCLVSLLCRCIVQRLSVTDFMHPCIPTLFDHLYASLHKAFGRSISASLPNPQTPFPRERLYMLCWLCVLQSPWAYTPGIRAGAERGATALTPLGATPKARTLWLLAKSYKQGRLCQLNRAVARCNGTNS